MSKKNRKLHPKKQKYKNLKYQIKEVELARLEKKMFRCLPKLKSSIAIMQSNLRVGAKSNMAVVC